MMVHNPELSLPDALLGRKGGAIEEEGADEGGKALAGARFVSEGDEEGRQTGWLLMGESTTDARIESGVSSERGWTHG